jgi:hypothetical protein
VRDSHHQSSIDAGGTTEEQQAYDETGDLPCGPVAAFKMCEASRLLCLFGATIDGEIGESGDTGGQARGGMSKEFFGKMADDEQREAHSKSVH